jgi:hypothetical protein
VDRRSDGPVVAHFLVNFLNLRYVAQVELPSRGEGHASGLREHRDRGLYAARLRPRDDPNLAARVF